MKTKMIYTTLGVLTVVGLSGLAWGGTKVAAEVADGNYPTIINNLAEKFGVEPAEVETVFEETRKADASSRLDEAVTDGNITEEQKALILARQEEMQAKREELRNQSLTEEERMEAMETLREECETWAEENDIPMQYVMGRGGFGGGRGEMGMGMGRGEGMHRGGF